MGVLSQAIQKAINFFNSTLRKEEKEMNAPPAKATVWSPLLKEMLQWESRAWIRENAAKGDEEAREAMWIFNGKGRYDRKRKCWFIIDMYDHRRNYNRWFHRRKLRGA